MIARLCIQPVAERCQKRCVCGINFRVKSLVSGKTHGNPSAKMIFL